MRVHSFVLLAVAAMVGCGDDVVVHTDGPPADLSVVDLAGTVDLTIPEDHRVIVNATQFNMDLASAICAHLMMCGRLIAANMQACIEANTPKLGFDENTEISKGRVQINEAQCLAAVMGARCDNSDLGGVFLGKCAKLLNLPMQPSDGTSQCLVGLECVNGYCAHGKADAGTAPEGCPGVCTPFKNLSDACGSDTECNQSVAFCDTGTNKCAAKGGAAATCTDLGHCRDGLYCAGYFTNIASPSGTCTMASGSGNSGDACDTIQDLYTDFPTCGTGLYCKPATGAPPYETRGTCAAKIASGMPCTAPTGFNAAVENPCVDGTGCFQTVGQTMATCQPFAGASQACDAAQASCQETLFCDNVTNPAAPTCKALIADNQPCDPTTNNHCLANAKHGNTNCIGATGSAVCVPEKPYNTTCNPVSDSPACGSDYCSPSNSRCSILCM